MFISEQKRKSQTVNCVYNAHDALVSYKYIYTVLYKLTYHVPTLYMSTLSI